MAKRKAGGTSGKKARGPKGKDAANLQRSTPSRKEKRVFVLSFEDKKSAVRYFQGLSREYREQVHLHFAPHLGTDPDNVVEAAKRAARGTACDQVWCVFDTEGPQHPARRNQVKGALETARELGFYSAPSNPCFEYWLLLHFQNCVKPYPDCSAVLKDLRKERPSYEKGNCRFEDFHEGIDQARKRAKVNFETRCQGQDALQCHPCTLVYKLVDELLGTK